MKVKQLADAFGVKVNDLEKITGYTRQRLWAILNEETDVNAKKFNTAIIRLKARSKMMYENDIKTAETQRDIRERLLSELDSVTQPEKGEMR